MKNFVKLSATIILLFALNSFCLSQQNLPACTSENNNVNYPDIKCCIGFYRCENGEIRHEKCIPELIFDSQRNVRINLFIDLITN